MIGEKMPGRKVPRVGDLDLDALSENVSRRIAANGRNRCSVLIDDAGYVRVCSDYRKLRQPIPSEWLVGRFTYRTPAFAIRMALANKIQETTK